LQVDTNVQCPAFPASSASASATHGYEIDATSTTASNPSPATSAKAASPFGASRSTGTRVAPSGTVPDSPRAAHVT